MDAGEFCAVFSCSVEFQKLGARGVSILVASGDQGVSGRAGSPRRFGPVSEIPTSDSHYHARGVIFTAK